MLDIRANLGRVQEAVARACARSGRSPDHVLLIAVSKTMDVERVRHGVAAGVAALGENRVQEAREKIEAIGPPGALAPDRGAPDQQGAGRRPPLRLDPLGGPAGAGPGADRRRAHAAERTLNVLLQVNLGDEPQKGGVAPARAEAPVRGGGRAARSARARPDGHPARGRAPEETRPYFRALRELRERLGLEHLSMGMSADFEVAIEEGATMVRVGTAIFGARRRGPDPGREGAKR